MNKASPRPLVHMPTQWEQFLFDSLVNFARYFICSQTQSALKLTKNLVKSYAGTFNFTQALATYGRLLRLTVLAGLNLLCFAKLIKYSIYIRTVRSQRLLSALHNWFELVYGQFGQSNMHSTFNFGSETTRKDSNVRHLKIC